MWLKKLRRLIRLFFFQLTGKKGDKVAKLTKPIIAVNIDGTVRVLNQDPNATHFNWYTRELLSYNITSPTYDTIVAGTNESKTVLPNTTYTNKVYITENYRDIRKFTSFKLYEAGETSGPSAVDVTDKYVTKISDFEYSISIPNVEHDYIITWGVGSITYTITSSLTNCVADKADESYVGGTAVNIVITAATGYTFDSSLGGTIGLSVGEVDKTSEYMTRSSDNKKVTIAIPATAAIGNIIYAAGAVLEMTQLATPTIAMNADGKTLEITDVANATSYDVYVDGTLKTNVARPSVYTVTFTRKRSGMNGYWGYSLDGGANWNAISQSATPLVVENVTSIKFRTKSVEAGFPYETYMLWDNPTGRIDCDTGVWVVSDTITPTGNMSVIYYGDNNPV